MSNTGTVMHDKIVAFPFVRHTVQCYSFMVVYVPIWKVVLRTWPLDLLIKNHKVQPKRYRTSNVHSVKFNVALPATCTSYMYYGVRTGS